MEFCVGLKSGKSGGRDDGATRFGGSNKGT